MNLDFNFHCLTLKEVFKETESSKNGLSKENAAKRLNLYGPNEINKKKKTSLIKKIYQLLKTCLMKEPIFFLKLFQTLQKQ